MDNAQKAIMLGVGLFITIIVIAAVMAITGIGQELLNQGQSQLSGLSGQLLAQVQSSYDRQNLSGTQVKTAVNKYWNDSTIAIYVYTANGPALSSGTEGNVIKLGNDQASRASAAYVTGTVDLVMPLDENNNEGGDPTKISENRNINGIDLTGNVTMVEESNTTSVSDITNKINSTSQFRSVLITNSNTGAVVGVAFIRYQ